MNLVTIGREICNRKHQKNKFKNATFETTDVLTFIAVNFAIC